MDERADERIRNKIVYSLNIMRIKPESAYEYVIIYYTIDFLSPPRGFGHLLWPSSGCVFRGICYKEHRNQITNIKY